MKVRNTLLLAGALLALLLVALAACGGASSVGVSRESGNATTVTVRLSDFAIEASQATFTSGTRYHFLVINTGQTNHEFMIVPPPSGDRDMGHGDMGHRDSMALYRMDQSALPPGATKAFDFT